jgi:hypothetical protein
LNMDAADMLLSTCGSDLWSSMARSRTTASRQMPTRMCQRPTSHRHTPLGKQ